MTLYDAKKGQRCRVTQLTLNHDTARRLEMLGLTGGSTVELVGRKFRGAVIVRIRGTRFALGREIAEGIEVADCGN